MLSILRGEISTDEAARKHGLSAAQVKDWENRFLRGAEDALHVGADRSSFLSARLFSDLKFRVALLAILVAWLGLRVVFWNGYYSEDSPGYVTDAIYLALGTYHARNDVNGLNVGTYLPVSVPIKLLGKSEIALSIWPMFSSLLGVVSVGAAAMILFGRAYGLLAALLYATYPGDVFFSTVVMPDAIQAGWLTFSVYLIVLASAMSAPPNHWLLAAGGIAMGICHLIRANDVILVPIGVSTVVILSTLWKRAAFGTLARGCLSYLSGWVLIILMEGLAYLWATGDFLHRFRVIANHYGTLASLQRWGLNVDLTTIPFSIFPPVLWWMQGGWGSFNPEQAYHALTFFAALLVAAMGAVALALTRRQIPDRATAGFAVGAFWFAWPLLYHQFGSQSLTQFVPMHRLSRHLVVYAPGAIFATVAGWFLIKEALSRRLSPDARTIVTATASAILLIYLDVNSWGARTAYSAFQRTKGTYVRIRQQLPQDVRTIVADPGDLCFLDFWLNPLGAERTRMVAFANYTSCEALTNGVVLTWSNPGWEGLSAPVIQETVKRLPCLLQPPASWRLLYEGYPEKVFVIEEGRRLTK